MDLQKPILMEQQLPLLEIKQKFTPVWILILLIFVILFFIYRTYQQLFLNILLGDSPMTNSGLIFFLVFLLILLCFFWILSLNICIDNSKLHIQFYPIHKKTISRKNIKSIEFIKYNGTKIGFGIRLSLKYGTIYRVKGNKGLFLSLKNDEKILIGVNNENQLKQFLKILKKP